MDNEPFGVQVMAWHRTGDKSLLEPMVTKIQYNIFLPSDKNAKIEAWDIYVETAAPL